MTIDVTTPESPGWWMQTLWKQLRSEQVRLRKLDNYRRGEPDIVLGSDRLKSAFHRFQNMCRTNYAEMIVSARTDRMSLRAIRTAASGDDSGDQAAWRVVTANQLTVYQTDLYRYMATFGAAYVAGGGPVEPGGEPILAVEDPRQFITEQDPLRPWLSRAAFKIFHDRVAQADYAILWLPGEKWVARRPRKTPAAPFGASPGEPVAVNFSPGVFDMIPVGAMDDHGVMQWDTDQPAGVLDPAELGEAYAGLTSERYELQDVFAVKFGNRDGVGVFEHHTDLLDRIAHVTLQQMVIATLQAFKQRAIETSPEAGEDGGLPDEDEQGNQIDYNAVFEADPGALWRLPIGAKIWESGQVDLSGILSASKDWVLQLAAVTQTPFPMFSPDSANQSANGASLYREGLTFSVEDLCRICGAGWAQVMALAFKLKGDTERGNAADFIIDWAPAERYSILEMAQADSLSSLPLPQKCSRIYAMTPAETQIVVSQSAQAAFMAHAMAPVSTAGQSATPAAVAVGDGEGPIADRPRLPRIPIVT